MKSSNPVFSRSPEFNGQSTNAYGNTTYPAAGATYPGYGQAPVQPGYADPSQWGTGTPTHAGPVERMSIDSVVQKTGITLGILVVVAIATWVGTGDINTAADASTLYVLAMVGAFGGLALSLVNSFKRVVSPALVIAYAALEGLFIGAFSKVMNTYADGAVTGAVIGTIAAFAGTLAAYKFFNIKVSDKFRKGVVAAMFGFVAVSLLDFALHFFGADFGFNGLGTMGLISSFLGLGLGILMLILDFDFVERGIEAGLPERESWRAAFGLTVTIIWIYIELLRIIAIFTSND